MKKILDALEVRVAGVAIWYDRISDARPHLAPILIALLAVTLFYVILVIPSYILINQWDALQHLIPLVSGHLLATASFLVVLFSIFLILAFALALRTKLKLLASAVLLRSWCSKHHCMTLANTALDHNARLVKSWMPLLDGAFGGQKKPSEGCVTVLNSLMSTYLYSLHAQYSKGKETDIAQGPASLHLLPTHFGPYAKCVEDILSDLSRFCSARGDSYTVSIRTLLTRDITGWFNILRILLPGKAGDPALPTVLLNHTAPWWETYKQQVHNDSLKSNKICLHRLLRLPTRDVIESQKNYLRLAVDPTTGQARQYLTVKEFFDTKSELERDHGAHAIVWLGGANFVNDDVAKTFKDIKIYPICLIKQEALRERLKSWRNYSFCLSNAYAFFKGCHTTGGTYPDKPNVPGSRAKVIEKNRTNDLGYISSFDDLFLIDFLRGQNLVGRVGISFRLDHETTVSGIQILENHAVDEAVEEFDTAWKSREMAEEL